MLSLIASPLRTDQSREALLAFIIFIFVCYHNNSEKAQPNRTKFSHMTFDWNSSAKFKDGHRRSHITPLIGGFCPTTLTTITLESLNQSKPNFHTRLRKWASQVTCNPPNRGSSTPLNINIPPISTNPNQILTHDF